MANWYTHSWNSDAVIFKSSVCWATISTLGGYTWLSTKNAVKCMPTTWAASTGEPPRRQSERTGRLRKNGFSRFGVVG